MAIALPGGKWPVAQSDAEALHELNALVLNALESQSTYSDDEAYQKLRMALLSNDEYSDVIPTFIRVHRSLPQLAAELNSLKLQTGMTAGGYAQISFDQLHDRAERIERGNQHLVSGDPPYPMSVDGLSKQQRVASSEWTGIPSKRMRVAGVKALLPAAMMSVDAILNQVELGHNGGPAFPLDDPHWQNLRNLHDALGQILQLAEQGLLDDDHGFGLIQQAGAYCQKAIHSFKNDPIRFAVIGSVTAIGSFIWGPSFIGDAILASSFAIGSASRR